MTLTKLITDRFPAWFAALEKIKNRLMSNTVLIGEVAAPTFATEKRMEYLLERFSEAKLLNSSADQLGNGGALLPGRRSNRTILVQAHLDTIRYQTWDHFSAASENLLSGPGIANNTFGVAVLASLPVILEELGIELDSDLLLLGTADSLGLGDIRGMRYFLENYKGSIDAAICLEGITLGRLSFHSIGMMNCRINCVIPDEVDWTKFGASGAIAAINGVIDKILAIPLPKRPRTDIVFQKISGGSSLNRVAKTAELHFEIRSESGNIVGELLHKIKTIIDEVASDTGNMIDINIISRRNPGGLSYDHQLVNIARQVMKHLQIDYRIEPSTSELAALIEHKIPALTLGLTAANNIDEVNESIDMNLAMKGIVQLLAILQAIDRGDCIE